MNYKDFACNISFFEFIQEEYKKPNFPIEKYEGEFQYLKNKLNIDFLIKLLESSPKAFDIFEQVFQLSRFTNTQYINFMFDVNILNNYEDNAILDYAAKSIFKFENGITNDLFNKYYKNYYTSENIIDIILALKRAIPDYISLCIKKKDALYKHISNSVGCRYRISKYLIENLKVDEMAQAIDFRSFLKIKRLPKDTKGLHGKFGTIKISKIFSDYQIEDISKLTKSKVIPLKFSVVPDEYMNKFVFIRERAIENILIRKKKKLKKFDFILLHRGLPVLAIETNFYSTSGTKIGINVGEYTDLQEDIKLINKNQSTKLEFGWITDGNFWLTDEGEQLFNSLKNNYFKGENELMNYNYFRKELPNLLNEISKAT